MSAYSSHNIFERKDAVSVLKEVKGIVLTMFPAFDPAFLVQLFTDIKRLFNGDYPGYRASTTPYHDHSHTTDVFLCTARLLDGANLSEEVVITPRMAELTLCAALFHDVGLIQDEEDTTGTGAKHTVGHEERSIAFMQSYFQQAGRCEEDIFDVARMIDATCLTKEFETIAFRNKEGKLCAQIMATADILGQMAGREYVEKLIPLYIELSEAGYNYKSPRELLENTYEFYQFIEKRITGPLGNVRRFSQLHFSRRRNIDSDVYMYRIEMNLSYLKKILKLDADKFLDELKRGDIINSLRSHL